MYQLLHRLARSAKGATAVEYGLVLALICVAGLTAMSNLADTTIDMWTDIATNVLSAG